MKNDEKIKLNSILLKYQLGYFTFIFSISLFIFFGYIQIQYLVAENLYKTSVNELLVQDFRSAILKMDQFVPNQFLAIKLIKNNHEFFKIGELKSSFLIHQIDYITKDNKTLIFYCSYRLLISILGIFLLLSLFMSRMLNRYLTRMFTRQLNDQVKLQKSELLNEISKKVAHDIRSPLSTLNLLAANIENIEVREMQKAVTKQIDQIANDLLNFSKRTEINHESSTYSIKEILLQIKKEYEIKAEKSTYQIIFDDQLSHDIKFRGLEVLYQNINNFINNSIEAEAKNIKVILKMDEYIQIVVSDDGKGMDESSLKKVGVVQYTTKHLSKQSGNGIGLLNAQKSITEKGWQMKIESTLAVGTTITILIPFKQTHRF